VLLFLNQTIGRKFAKYLGFECQWCMPINIFSPACHCKIAVEIKPIKAFKILTFFCSTDKRLFFGQRGMDVVKWWQICLKKVQMWMPGIR
jgi:hypothetical protein